MVIVVYDAAFDSAKLFIIFLPDYILKLMMDSSISILSLGECRLIPAFFLKLLELYTLLGVKNADYVLIISISSGPVELFRDN